jgi:arylsulfatase A-like enzyme
LVATIDRSEQPLRPGVFPLEIDRRRFLLASLGGVLAAGAAGGTIFEGRRLLFGSGEHRRYGQTVIRRRHAASDAPNVLLLGLDDCNDWLGFLNNHPGTKTPNLDALAARSLVFSAAYCAAPMCLPSRTANLFGLNPWETGIYDHSQPSRANYQRMTTVTPSVIDDIWAAGYDTYSAGKVFDGAELRRWTDYERIYPYVVGAAREDPAVRPDQFNPDWISPYDGKPIGSGKNFPANHVDFGPSGATPRQDPNSRGVAWIADHLAASHRRPFLLAFGSTTPHEPWRVPKQFFDMHPLEEVVVPDFGAKDLADLSAYARDDIIDAQGHIFKEMLRAGIWKRAVQAYQAAVSFADWQMGVALDALSHSRYADDTIVALWSDHGYHLGEKMHFEKFTLWERATRVPFLLHVPGRFDHHDEFSRPVTMMDMGPTLVELCGGTLHENNRGKSLLPTIADPTLADARPPIMTWLAGNHAVRRGPWRYIRYRTGDTELYDVHADPNELTNLSGHPKYAATIAQLDRYLPKP